MTDSNPNPPVDDQKVTPPVVDAAKTETVDVEKLQKDLETWKHFSRKNEDEKKEALAELDKLKQGQMSDAEKAIEAAKAAGKSEAAQTYGEKLVNAELKAAAATAGVEIPAGLKKYMKFSELLDTNGDPDSTKIAELVSSFKPKDPDNPFAQNLGIGATGGKPPERDWSPQAFASRVKGRNPLI